MSRSPTPALVSTGSPQPKYSLIFTSLGHEAAALLFAGGDQGGSNGKGLTFANPITAVFDQLKVALALK